MNQFVKSFFESYCISIQSCLQGIYNFLVALAVVVAFIFFLIGAFEYLLSTIPDVKIQGKDRMKNTIKGLIIIFVSGVILYWINPYIFNAKIMIFRITKLQVPILTLEESTTTISYGGIQIPMSDLDLDKFKYKECISQPITAFITFYYTPISTEFGGMLHKFLSLTTLQGSSIVSVNGNWKVLNYSEARNIIKNTKLHGYQQCGGGWAWTWPTNENIYNNGKYCNGKWVQPDQESIKYGPDTEFINITAARKEMKNQARSVSFTTTLSGTYGPLIPFKTGAINPKSTLFKRNYLIKFLDCGGCKLQNELILLTDTGRLKNNQIDIYAGVGEVALQNASTYKPRTTITVNGKPKAATIVCVVGQRSSTRK